jgi:hypothetical protein
MPVGLSSSSKLGFVLLGKVGQSLLVSMASLETLGGFVVEDRY